MYNFGELKDKVAVLVRRSGDTDYKTKIGVWLQMSHKLLSEIYDYFTELQDIHNFTTVDGRENYPLPNRFDKPFRLYDLTNEAEVKIDQTEEEYFDTNLSAIANSDEGKPSKGRIYGISGSTVQVASSGKTLQVKSSSSSDTGSIVIRIQGYIDSSHLIEDYENITVSTSSPTTYVAGTKTFYQITHISKSANTTGYITIADSDSTILEYLAPNERVARHKILKLGLIPDSAYSMRLLFKKIISEMVNDYDYPFTECDRYLIFDAVGWAYSQEKDGISNAEQAWKEAAKALQTILNNQSSKLGPNQIKQLISQWLARHRF